MDEDKTATLQASVDRLARKLEAFTHDPERDECDEPAQRERFYVSANVGQMLRWRVIDRKYGGLRYIAAFRNFDHAEAFVEWAKENIP